jgi:hypothetical protein
MSNPIFTPNGDDIRDHINWHVAPARGAYDDGLIEIAYGSEGPDKARLFGLDEIDQAVAFAMEKNADRNNIYIAVALRLPDTPRNKRASGADFYVATAVPIDIDSAFDDTVRRLQSNGDIISARVMTGSKPEVRGQVWLRLTEPCDCPNTFAEALSATVEFCGGDRGAKGAGRVMRLAGTVNYPSKDKQSRGYQTEPTTLVIDQDTRPVEIAMLSALAPTQGAADKRSVEPRRNGESGIEYDCWGKVINGRETYWRNLCFQQIADYQDTYGTDPTAAELFDLAYSKFSDPSNADHSDQRWTSAAGQDILRKRAANTIRRLQNGTLGSWGLGSVETGEGQEQAEAIKAQRAHLAPNGQAQGGQEERPNVALEFLDPWEKLEPAAFPLDALPAVVRDFAQIQAVSTGGDLGALVMAALAACSGALDQQFRLKMKRTGDWFVAPRLWVMLVGDPSSRKSPIIRAAIKKLSEADGQEMAHYKDALVTWQASKKSGDGEQGDPPNPPNRLILRDATPEAFVKIIADQPRGVLMVLDEFSGFIGAMDKYSGSKGSSADRAMWLQSYDGGPYSSDRVGRGLIYVPNLAVSFLAGIQPTRLAELTNLSSDGLLQRFVPVIMGRCAFPQEIDDEAPARRFYGLIERLLQMRPEALKPSQEALEAFDGFQREIYQMEQLETLGDAFRTFLGKLTGLHGSLATILHLIEDSSFLHPLEVSGKAAIAAARILKEYVIPHAYIFYSQSADAPNWELIRQIGSYILTQDQQRFTTSYFTSGVRGLRGTDLRTLSERLSPFVAGGWLQEDGVAKPAKAWTVSPSLRAHFADRRASERAQKAEARHLIKLAGKERQDDKS